jgi:hypothetical protein
VPKARLRWDYSISPSLAILRIAASLVALAIEVIDDQGFLHLLTAGIGPSPPKLSVRFRRAADDEATTIRWRPQAIMLSAVEAGGRVS